MKGVLLIKGWPNTAELYVQFALGEDSPVDSFLSVEKLRERATSRSHG